MKGIDCATPLTLTTAKKLAAEGVKFACRYLVPQRLAWKRLTRAEAEAITEAGLQIISVYETSANRPAGGAAAGEADGREAMAEAKLIGQPLGSAIYFAVDYDAQPKDYNAIEAYLRAAAKQIDGYKVGVYGSFAVIEEMARRGAAECFWQTYAWSKGKKSSRANLYQYQNGVALAGITVDLNESFGGEGFWNTKPAPKPQPQPEPKPVSYGGAFRDVPDDHYAKAATDSLAAKGIMNGIGDGLFGFGKPITREDAAVIVDRAISYLEQKIAQQK